MSTLPKVQPGKVILNGENPFIWLSETQGGKRTTEASIWTITYSEKGHGHALFLKSELTNNEWNIYSDNEEMTRWLQNTVQGMLNPETSETTIPVIKAFFTRSGDTQKEWVQEVKSKKDNIKMTWRFMKSPILVQDETVSAPGRPYGVNVVMLPATEAELLVNGEKAKGSIWPMILNGHPFSTGALAFSESWREGE